MGSESQYLQQCSISHSSRGSSTNNHNILEETDDRFVFPEGALLPGQDNVITVVQVRFQTLAEPHVIDFFHLKDNMGLNQTEWREQTQVNLELNSDFFPADPDTSKSPRGIRGFKVEGGAFSEWKVQGKIGGYMK